MEDTRVCLHIDGCYLVEKDRVNVQEGASLKKGP